MIVELTIEGVVRWAFKIRRQIEEVWERCLEEEQAAAVGRLTPEQLEQRAIAEAFESRSRAKYNAAAAGVVRARHEAGRETVESNGTSTRSQAHRENPPRYTRQP